MSADDHRALLRDSIRTFLARHGERARVRALRGTMPGYERAHWQRLAELGCVGALVPAAHGGVGLQLGDMAAMVQALAPSLAPEPVVPVAIGAVRLLSLAPDTPLSARLLPAIAAGELVPCVILAAAGARAASDAAAPAPSVILDAAASPVPVVLDAAAGGSDRGPKACTLRGHASNTLPAAGDGYLVVASHDGARALCWVAAGTPGVSVTTAPRIDGTAVATVRFDDVPVAPESFIAGLSPAGTDRVIDECRIGTAAELLGVAESALAMTLDYLRVREQFGKPIGSFQALQHRAVDLYLKKELTRAAVDAALDGATAEVDDDTFALLAARAKARAAESALAICREAVQLHGAMGFADECDVGLHLKRALVLSAWLGNATTQRARVQQLHAVRAVATETRRELPPVPQPGESIDWDALPDDDFRLRVRALFEAEYPQALRNPPRRLRWAECRDFYRKLGRVGLLALAWPKEFGGAGLSPRKQLVFMQEQDRWGVARAPDMGVTMVGPALIRYGTPEQRARYMPAILAFEHMWCQGFSEPNAGSDLASLRTQAVRDGDGWIIDGAKTWTTFAQDATHMFMLARTDKSGKKQAGITVFLVDLKTPGITVRPICDIAGNEEFCEVHFAGVRVPGDAVLGPVNDGWTVAKMLLGNERIYLGNPRQSQYALKRVDSLAKAQGLQDDPVFMARLTQLRLDVWDLAALYERFADQVRRGEPLGHDVSILKLFGSETYQRLSELAVECVGDAGALAGDIAIGDLEDNVLSLFMNARPSTIYGGSNEVQRNVLAKQVLKLPG